MATRRALHRWIASHFNMVLVFLAIIAFFAECFDHRAVLDSVNTVGTTACTTDEPSNHLKNLSHADQIIYQESDTSEQLLDLERQKILDATNSSDRLKELGKPLYVQGDTPEVEEGSYVERSQMVRGDVNDNGRQDAKLRSNKDREVDQQVSDEDLMPGQAETFHDRREVSIYDHLTDTNDREIYNNLTDKERHIDDLLTFTCVNRCGTYTSSACSCNKVCVLYNTCCENFAQDCPHLERRGREIYGDYLGATIECNNGVRMVTSAKCSNDIYYTQKSVERDIGLNETINSIHSYILNAPVTDSATGLTYLNKEIYDCYKKSLNLSHMGWSWNFRQEYTSGYSMFKSAIPPSLSRHIYQPMFDSAAIAPHFCVPLIMRVIESCNDTTHMEPISDKYFSYYSQKCQEFTGYLKSSATGTMYRNRYCLYCYEARHDQLFLSLQTVADPFRYVYGFSILVDLSADGSYIIKASDLTEPKLKPAWSTAKCKSVDNIVEQSDHNGIASVNSVAIEAEREGDSPSCEILQCNKPTFTLRSDGLCKADYHMTVGFKDNELSLDPLTCQPAAAHLVGEFISCSLDISLTDSPWDRVSEFSTPAVSTSTDSITNETFYFVEMFFTTTVRHSSVYQFGFYGDEDKNLLKLIPVIKAYHVLRLSNKFCPPSYENGDRSLSNIKNVVPRRKFPPWQLELFLQYSKPYRGKVLNGNMTTTVCASLIRPASVHLDVSCFEDPLFEHDQRYVADLLRSRCALRLNSKTLKEGKSNMAAVLYLHGPAPLCLTVTFVIAVL